MKKLYIFLYIVFSCFALGSPIFAQTTCSQKASEVEATAKIIKDIDKVLARYPTTHIGTLTYSKVTYDSYSQLRSYRNQHRALYDSGVSYLTSNRCQEATSITIVPKIAPSKNSIPHQPCVRDAILAYRSAKRQALTNHTNNIISEQDSYDNSLLNAYSQSTIQDIKERKKKVKEAENRYSKSLKAIHTEYYKIRTRLVLALQADMVSCGIPEKELKPRIQKTSGN